MVDVPQSFPFKDIIGYDTINKFNIILFHSFNNFILINNNYDISSIVNNANERKTQYSFITNQKVFFTRQAILEPHQERWISVCTNKTNANGNIKYLFEYIPEKKI